MTIERKLKKKKMQNFAASGAHVIFVADTMIKQIERKRTVIQLRVLVYCVAGSSIEIQGTAVDSSNFSINLCFVR